MHQWKKQIGTWYFLKNIKSLHSQRTSFATGLKSRTHPKVLILFDAMIDKLHGLSQQVSDLLKAEGYKTELLGFFADKNEHDGTSFSYINEKSQSWLGKPKGTLIDNQKQQHWDMLITLHDLDHLPIAWLVSELQVDLKIGTSALYPVYDIVLEGHANGFTGFPDHLSRILHTLKKSAYAYA